MRRILSLMAVVALMVAFAMPVMTADADSHGDKKPMAEKTMDKAMEKGKEAGDKAMKDMKAKGDNPCNADAKQNPCNPCGKPKQ